MNGNRQVGGLWCSEVLAGLSEYLDGDLAPEAAVQVEAHVSACTNCARFGAEIGGMIEAVAAAAHSRDIPSDVAARLRTALLLTR